MTEARVAEVLARLSEAEARFSRTQAQAELSKAQAKCAKELRALRKRAHGSAAIVEAGAIPPLVAMLSGGPESEAAEQAAQTLWDLTFAYIASSAAIVEAGAIPLLVALLRGGPKSAEPALGLLRNLGNFKDASRCAAICSHP